MWMRFGNYFFRLWFIFFWELEMIFAAIKLHVSWGSPNLPRLMRPFEGPSWSTLGFEPSFGGLKFWIRTELDYGLYSQIALKKHDTTPSGICSLPILKYSKWFCLGSGYCTLTHPKAGYLFYPNRLMGSMELSLGKFNFWRFTQPTSVDIHMFAS